ncbi:MAG: response regulator transcription factor [Clostridiales bacterium]|jgi:two-component system alkaline phosphatase synthesis response regulator PhoP|nr:response regulator transcription factor [Clostridiales bacterium]
MATEPRIYIVEDDENIRELVIYALKANGFDASGFGSSAEFFEAYTSAPKPALVLLDIMLPDDDGVAILRKLHAHFATPVIMLTAKGSEFDKVKGLDAGADDYVTKPFGITELIARINAVLRRSGPARRDTLSFGSIVIDDAKHEVFVSDAKIELTLKEYDLLRYLVKNADIVVSRGQIMECVWGFDFEGETRTVDIHIQTLRKKLGEAGGCIKTVRGVGYKVGE